ncbi:HNH endonuclease signature motif containing protein [Nocardioides salsibiostraticola]
MAKDTSTLNRDHPIVAAACDIQANLAGVTDHTTWSMRDEDARETVLLLTELEAQVAELGRRVLAEADRRDVAGDTGGTSTANWLAHTTKLTRSEANRRVKQAKALDTHEQTRCALATGDLHVEQAEVIARAVESLPTDKCPPETVAAVEKVLIDNATEFDAKTLKILGWRVWEVLDPEGAEAFEAEQLAKEEDSARDKTKLIMHDDGTGAVRGRFVIPSAQGAMFRKLLLAFAAPKHQASKDRAEETDDVEELTERIATPKRMGEAFCELIESFRAEDAPRSGGVSATAVIHLDYDTLIGGLKPAHLDTGEPVSPGLARRIACEAGILPVILNGTSQVLDLGRTRRYHSKSQRIAASLEHPTCQAANCDWPSGMSHMHHLDPWHQGGSTDLKKTAVLCPRHHTLIHHHDYAHEIRPDGTITFHRRT